MKKKEELSFELDMSAINEINDISNSVVVNELPVEKQLVLKKISKSIINEDDLICCLRNERIEVLYIPLTSKIIDKSHPFYGGFGENSKMTISVPRLRSGNFANVLTNAEKKYLEYVMGLEDGALSIYNRVNNFWSNNTEGGISKVILSKRDNYFDLSIPEDYIRYKILLSDKEHICPDVKTLHERPKATYKFVIISANETNNESRAKLNYKRLAYTEYNKIENDYDTLKTVLEIITYKTQSAKVSLEYLQELVLLLIEENAKVFLSVIKDENLKTKVLIGRAVDAGIIIKRANQYFLALTREPLCDAGEEATLTIAAKFLTMPKNQEIKFGIEGKLNN